MVLFRMKTYRFVTLMHCYKNYFLDSTCIDSAPVMRSCEKQPDISTLGGRINCPRCQASSKRTKQQCRSPAIKGKRVCAIHGGKSTGPKTDAGKQRCAAAKTIHGWETREKRRVRAEALRELRELASLARDHF
jgi:uncharacterized Zn finger protein (UPF0148 family)